MTTPSNIAPNTPAHYNPMIEMGNMLAEVTEEENLDITDLRKKRNIDWD